MYVDMGGGVHTFGERGVHRGFMKGVTWGSRKERSQGVHKKGGSREPYEHPCLRA